MTFKKQIFIILVAFLAASFIFFAYQESWIILMVPYNKKNSELSLETKPAEAILFFWKNEKWATEKTSFIQSSDITENIQALAHLYFRLLDDEKIVQNDVTINSVILHANKQIAFISFNQSPFSQQDYTRHKLMIIEGLFKTLRENAILVPSIQFLVNHQPLQDDHLDFTIPWALQGYL